MCKIIAIANQKGGVAKTTTTINLGVGLSKVGKRVMLIDADPQGHLTMGLGFPKNLRVTLKTMMENIIMGLEFDPREAILHHEEGIDVIPSNKLLSGMDMSLFTVEDREKVLVILLSHIEPLIYNTLNYTKQPYSKVKQIVKRMSIDENEGMSSESVGKLYVMGITYVVFANTDAYTKEIDKRIPFRNNILHNGIVEYGTDDIHSAYELLVEFISMLVFIKKQLINEKTK